LSHHGELVQRQPLATVWHAVSRGWRRGAPGGLGLRRGALRIHRRSRAALPRNQRPRAAPRCGVRRGGSFQREPHHALQGTRRRPESRVRSWIHGRVAASSSPAWGAR